MDANTVSASTCATCGASRGEQHLPSCMHYKRPPSPGVDIDAVHFQSEHQRRLLHAADRDRNLLCAQCGAPLFQHWVRVPDPAGAGRHYCTEAGDQLFVAAAKQPQEAQAPDADGWIAWKPGQPRPSGDEVVDWVNSQGASAYTMARSLRWGDDPDMPCGAPVVKYRLKRAHPADAKVYLSAAGASPEQVERARAICDAPAGTEDAMRAVFVVPGFEALAAVLVRAYQQAATGKGAERHGSGKPFDEQPMQDLIRLHGLGFATGQASKKAQEAQRLPPDRAVRELLGAIVYLAGAIIAIEAGSASTTTTTAS